MAPGIARCVTGFCELLPLRLSHGYSLHNTLLTHVHAPEFSLPGCDDDMMPHHKCVLAEVLNTF